MIGAGAMGFVLGRSTLEPAPAPPAAASPEPGSSPLPSPVLPAVQPPLGRAELIAAAGSAADAFAAEAPLPESVTKLAGREFELRLPFGCPGAPRPAEGALTAEYDRSAEALRVRAEPVRWTPQEWLPNPEDRPRGAPAVESIEGFWIARPWTSSEACPAPVGANMPPVAAERTLAIAQFFTAGDSRVGRRDGKAYEAVESVAPEAQNMRRDLRLRLRGKLTRAPGAGLVVCSGPDGARPACVISATLDEVAIENSSTRTTLATWDVASQTREAAAR